MTSLDSRPPNPPSTAALVATGLRKTFGRREVVKGVGFHVEPGEIVGLLGPNGAGKTTSFRMVAGLLTEDAGRVTLAGADLSGLPLHRRARLGLGYLPQEASIFRKLTVRQNLAAVLEGRPSGDSKAREARVAALLEEFHLTHVAGSLGETLSGGERRRAEIARSLLAEPKFLLFDEPFAGVDPIAVGALQDQIRKLRERRIGVLITDHSVRETLGICDRAYILTEGSILVEGSPVRLAADPTARAAYLGAGFRLGDGT